jgi:ubiquinone/menaquinone biosynthesis C-methylase UbiE
MQIDTELIEQVSENLSPRDNLFLKRIFADGLDKYQRRISAIGFQGFGEILDAGCGFGQWSLALASVNQRVEACDISIDRLDVAQKMASNSPNIRFCKASLENLPYNTASFDAVFCYSVIYYTDIRRSISELCRVLKPEGKIYICSNGFGWYIYNFLNQPNKSPDFDPRQYALRTFLESSRYLMTGKSPSSKGSIITSRTWLKNLLIAQDVNVIACDGEGKINFLNSKNNPYPIMSFFPSKYYGMECVSEWLGEKGAIDFSQ